jgi:predicted dehydrogenase
MQFFWGSMSSEISTILKYDSKTNKENINNPIIISTPKKLKGERIVIGLIGSGSFATNTLLPIIYENSDKFHLKTIVNSTGDKALNVASQFKAEMASSNPDDIFNDKEIDLIMICTRHNNHAELVLRGLESNKQVFVEKPLAVTLNELNDIENFFKTVKTNEQLVLMVGFNRRFSKYAGEIKRALNNRTSPVLLHYRMNAGFVPYDSWIHEDGGRIVGEACHLIDLMLFLTDSEVIDYAVNNFNPNGGRFKSTDNRSISLKFKDGSVAVIDYFSCGSKQLSKEYLEVHFDNKTIIMDDYKSLKGYGIKVKHIEASISQKGHKEEWLALHDALKKGQWPIPLESLIQTTRLSILASE